MNRINKAYRICGILCGLVALIIVANNILLDRRFYYVHMTKTTIPNWVFAVGMAFLLFGIFLFYNEKKKSESTQRDIRRIMFILSAILLVVQVFMAWNIYFVTGWDCKEILDAVVDFTENGVGIGTKAYFSMYPNNVFLTGAFSIAKSLTDKMGITNYRFAFIVVGCVFVNLSGYLMADMVFFGTRRKDVTLGTWFAFVILTGLSPWITIPYSDTYSIFAVTFCIWFFVTNKRRWNPIRFFFFSYFGLIGAFVKPTTIFAVVIPGGFLLFETICKRENREKVPVKKAWICLGATILGILLAIGMNKGMYRFMQCELDETKSFTPVHYFMMGMNRESGGSYNQWDVNFSAGLSDVNERNKVDFEEGLRRIKKMGFLGFSKFIVQKSLTNFNDGSFAWGMEGAFYWEYIPREGKIADLLRQYFYEKGKYYSVFLTVNQGVWMLAILSIPLILLPVREERRKSFYFVEAAITLTLFALCMFLIVFEARARYLFLYTPVIYTASAYGITHFLEWTSCLKKRKMV